MLFPPSLMDFRIFSLSIFPFSFLKFREDVSRGGCFHSSHCSRQTLSLWRRRSLFSSGKHHHHFMANPSLQLLFSCLQRSLRGQGSSRVNHLRLSSLIPFSCHGGLPLFRLPAQETHYTDIFQLFYYISFIDPIFWQLYF